MQTKAIIEITLYGETREIECWVRGSARIDTVGTQVAGRFPTGNKLHLSTLTLWKRDRGFHSVTGAKLPDLRGATAATYDGDEYIADSTLYTHNSNRGRIVCWATEAPEPVIAKW
jgi:hypothetical protein